ncbi:cation chloride cotransporter-like protein [Lentithecium fluviatile CBS 122367]|uniref:Cation chloride cotransporter-like protein n=1 Tax=Lentithecium fluviatile CBS 122367 TaxID=1168545 RepID=A0A6G1IZP2_9PLEO|nr:cation chloride cotransporter-like protein [Lentithecium fluviatile CBS 122367]
MTDEHGSQARRRMPPRIHSTFAARTARDEAEQLNRRGSLRPMPSPSEETPLLTAHPNPQGVPAYDGSPATSHERDHGIDSPRGWFSRAIHTLTSKSPEHASVGPESKKQTSTDGVKPRPGAFPRPVGGTGKLGTFAGVFVPTTLNVLSILMFLRFGFILGQTGVVGMMGMLVACYAINLLTTMSISAIATNGTVRGGGAYYLISRSLGPEFGGSIGLVFFLGMVFNTSMNAVGLIDCFVENFGADDGSWSQWMQQGFWWQFLWATIVLGVCTAICLAGSGIFARCSNGLLVLLLIATFSIPLSTLIVHPFTDPKEKITYTGLSLDTFRQNLMPKFRGAAAGSVHKHRPNFQDMFGILFPATGGIFAGASMSGDLKHPSKAIPKGTLYGLALTFFSYAIVILAMAATITRESLYSNTNVIQLTNISGVVILLGEFATSAFSVLMGVIGSAKLLQALARDSLLPGLSIFGQGTQGSDDPTYAIFITYTLAQLTMLSDINQIASFITMTYLMTFLVTNLACFLLKIGSAPNFRPSFHFFNWQTAAIGTIVSGATMFFVDGMYASACVGLLIVIFLLIHYTTPPKPWGDVSQSLIYHQVRKYLLRLRQEHVKFWRPQILLLVNDPRRQYKLIQFCNSLKKGALFVLGHVIVSQDFGAAVPEARRQQQSWTKYIDFSKIKAFVNIAISPAVEWGARNIVLGAGLGGMRPNIVVMGFYNLGELRQSKPPIDIPSPQPSRPSSKAANYPISRKAIQAAAKRRQADQVKLSGILPTDAMKPENAIGIHSYVTILEDLLLRLQINVALAKGFQDLEIPIPKPTKKQRLLHLIGLGEAEDEEPSKTYIDLWPIQMSAEIAAPGTGEDPSKKNALTTNFDTYTLILQLGCILHTVPSWKRTYKLRVAVFVEYETDVEEERERVTILLKSLRIEADVLVFWLASGNLKMYEVIVNGRHVDDFVQAAEDVDDALEDEEWWGEIQRMRKPEEMSASREIAQASDLLEAVTNWPTSSFQHGRRESKPKRFAELKKLLRRTKRRTHIDSPGETGANINMQAQRLSTNLLSDSDFSSSGGEDCDRSDEEAIVTESDVAASENDLDEYDLDASDDDSEGRITPIRRSKSTSASGGIPFISDRLNLRRALWKGSPQQEDRPTTDSVTPLRPHPNVVSSDTAVLTTSKGKTSSITGSPKSQLSSSPQTKAIRPPPIRHQSLPKFTSKPQPRTAVVEEETPGPSIMFVDTPSPITIMKKDPIASSPVPPSQLAAAASSANPGAPKPPSTTIPATLSPSTTNVSPSTINPSTHKAQATGFPLQSAIPLSFNDLPCRAQHLILNELIRQNSDDTAVVFTTLPSPMEGTGESEMESVKYISDLEVLCQGLPPCLLVHSNSMTVTMNL